MKNTPEPGVYRGISHEEYWTWPAANHSSLRKMDQSPAHAHHAWTLGGPESTALRLGDATHAAVLEPDRFDAQYFQGPTKEDGSPHRRGTNAWNEALEANEGKTALKPDEYQAAITMSQRIRAHSIAGPILKHANEIGGNEVSYVWRDGETGVLCKARTDVYSRYLNYSCLADLKSTGNASEWAFGKSCADYGYHTQARFYLDGLQALAPSDRRFLFLAVEKTAPWGIRVHELGPNEMEVAAIKLRSWLRQWATCLEKDSWPGYPTTIGMPVMPKYAMDWGDFDDE